VDIFRLCGLSSIAHLTSTATAQHAKRAPFLSSQHSLQIVGLLHVKLSRWIANKSPNSSQQHRSIEADSNLRICYHFILYCRIDRLSKRDS
jgi:hypothetical protein